MSEVLILKAFAAGADGVLVSGCHPGDCHYVQGNLNARRRVAGIKPFLEAMGVEPDRLSLEWISASEGPKIAETAKTFTQKIKQLGSSQFNRSHNSSCDQSN